MRFSKICNTTLKGMFIKGSDTIPLRITFYLKNLGDVNVYAYRLDEILEKIEKTIFFLVFMKIIN